jgi:hypothetical protein
MNKTPYLGIMLPALKNVFRCLIVVFENRLSCQPDAVFKWLALLLCTWEVPAFTSRPGDHLS